MSKQQEEKLDLEWPIEPKEENWTTAKCLLWQSKCGRYRIYRIDSCDGEKIKFGVCVWNGKDWWSIEGTKLGPGYPRYYFDLSTALFLCQEHSAAYTSNSQSVLAYALQQKLTVAPTKAKEARHNASQPLEKGSKETPPKPKAPRSRVISEGSPVQKALQVLTQEPKNMKTIMEEAGLTSSIYNKLNALAKEGKLRKTSEGYCLNS